MRLRFRGRMVEGEALLLKTVDVLREEESVFMARAADEAGEMFLACRFVGLLTSFLIEGRICESVEQVRFDALGSLTLVSANQVCTCGEYSLRIRQRKEAKPSLFLTPGLRSTIAYSAGGNSGPRRTLTKKEKDHFFLKAQNP